MENKDNQSLWQLFYEFFKIGVITIGGGLVMLPIIRELAVNKKKWLSDEEMTECIVISQSVSGIIAINVATYIGYKIKGKKGAVVATLGAVLPAFLIIVLFYGAISNISSSKIAIAAVKGMKAGLVGVLLTVVWFLGKKTLIGPFHYVSFFLTFFFTAILECSALLTLVLWGFVAVVYFYLEEKIKARRR